ncbi:hypothetical protein N0V88_007510 [Collariella sp. IMI 366227]|nr:hypothetical protein N0V88_007510 [Collariella sp. IMI 366227]
MAPPQITDDYYEVLQVTQAADEGLIKANYRRLAKIQHPDKNPNDPTAKARFQLLQAAYSTLIDLNTRRTYDTISYPSIRARKTLQTSQPTTTNTSLDALLHQHTLRLRSLHLTLQTINTRLTTLDTSLTLAKTLLSKTIHSLDTLNNQSLADKASLAAENGWARYITTSLLGIGQDAAKQRREAIQRRMDERRTGMVVLEARRRVQSEKVDEIRGRLGG